MAVRGAGRTGWGVKFCATCNQDRAGDKFCTVCGTEFAAEPNTDTFTIKRPRTKPAPPATEMVNRQPPAGQSFAETQVSGAPAWSPPAPGQPAWSPPDADQPATQTYYPGPRGAAQPPADQYPATAQYPPAQYPPAQYSSPGAATPPGQYPAPGQYTPPGQYPAPGQYTPPGQYPVPGPGGGRPGSGRGRAAVLASVAAVVVVAAGAGAFALVSSLHHGTSTTPPSSPSALGQTTSSVTTPSATPDQTTTPAGTTSSSSGPPSTVTLSSAAASSPVAKPVQSLFNRYFNSINTRNYTEYSGTLDSTMQANTSQSHFDSGYATTTDSSEEINSITDNGDGSLTVSVSFTSTQDPSDSVDHSSCNKWTLNLPLVPQGSGYVLSTPPSGYATYTDC